MDSIDLGKIKKIGICYKTVDMNNLHNRLDMNPPQKYMVNDEIKKKIMIEKREKIEDKIISVITNSKENIKSTVPVINNVNKQLIQNNLLLKMKIENMKQTYKNIINHCTDLRLQITSTENNQSYEVLNNIIDNLNSEIHKTKEER